MQIRSSGATDSVFWSYFQPYRTWANQRKLLARNNIIPAKAGIRVYLFAFSPFAIVVSYNTSKY